MTAARHVERFTDAHHRVEVTWQGLDMVAQMPAALRQFHAVATSVAGGPPALETFDPRVFDLMAFHVVALSDPDPADWHFVTRGWTGVDSRGWRVIGDVGAESEAMKQMGVTSYLRSAYAGPTLADVEREAAGVPRLNYSRLCVPQTDRLYGRPYFLWIGLAR